MKELLEKIVMYSCFAGIGGVAIVALVRATLPVAAERARGMARNARQHGVAATVAVILFVCGMIVYGSTKNNSRTNVTSFQLQRQVRALSAATTNALARVEKWWRRGAFNDGQIVRFDSDWCFPYGTNHLTRVEVWASGAVYPSLKDPTPIVELATKLSLKPHDTEVFIGRTTNNTYRIEWHNGHPNRAHDQFADASIELFRNGNAIVTENGVTTTIPYAIPFAHDGIGQDEDWVRANFARLQALAPALTNAEEILSVGYANWIDAQVGVGLANGLYKFTASFEDAPPEATQLYIGDCSVCVTNAGEYVFLLEKGTGYEFGTLPFNDAVDYYAQDDMAADAPMLMSWWGGSDSPGEWSIDGGWNWLCYPSLDYPGSCNWMPTLRGSPDVSHLGSDNFPVAFEAVLSDYCADVVPTFHWSASSEDIQFNNPNAQTTTVTCASLPSWGSLSMSVQANLGWYSLYSYLYPTYGTNETPQVYLSLDAPEGLALNGARRKLTASFGSDVETNGCVTVHCTRGEDKVSFWSSFTNGVFIASSNTWNVASTNSFSCYVQGAVLSDYEGVEFECSYTPLNGSNKAVRVKSTVFECHTQPVSNTIRSGREVVNPSFLTAQSNAVFRVEVSPVGVPASRINWRTVSGTAIFQGGTNGLETVVQGGNGMVDLEVSVLGATDERMHFKAEVIQ